MLAEFGQLWQSPCTRAYQDCREDYARAFARRHRDRQEARKAEAESRPLIPNSMQQRFVNRLLELTARGEHRALLISATGTGKTYASAFAVRALESRKTLFLVHRGQIARQA